MRHYSGGRFQKAGQTLGWMCVLGDGEGPIRM